MPEVSAARRGLPSYAAALGRDPAGLELVDDGQRHDVVLDRGQGVAWRFPRTDAALGALEVSARRAAAARTAGLPAPRLLAVVDGPLGVARAAHRLVPGAGMEPELLAQLDDGARERLVGELAALLAVLRRADVGSWPGAPLPWAERWAALTGRLRTEVLPLIPEAAGRGRAAEEVDRAERAAASIGSAGLTHGDLGGANVRVDPSSGSVLGVLDWDDAAPGDPAVDLAAIRVHAPRWLLDRLMAADASLAELVERADAYVGTFALQEALWGLDAGDPGAVESGLSDYR